MIITDYYKTQQLTNVESRYDVTHSSQSYELFENLLINKQDFNAGGLSLSYIPRPKEFKGMEQRITEMALTKGNVNITSVFVPDIRNIQFAYGDVNTTNDGLLIQFSADKTIIELFIARGYKYDIKALFNEFKHGFSNAEFEFLRANAKEALKEKETVLVAH